MDFYGPLVSGYLSEELRNRLKWNFTRLLFGNAAPFNGAVRAFRYFSSSLNYNQSLDGDVVNVDFSNQIFGGTLDVGTVLWIFEPYIGYGVISHSSTLSGSGDVTIFNTNFPVDTNVVTATGTSGWFRAGLEVRLLVLTLGAQYDTAFSTGNDPR